MRARHLFSVVLFALCAVAGGCGGSSSTSNGAANPSDKQESTRRCLEADGFSAVSQGATIEVDGPDGPRVEFNISGGESETRAFKGEAQGAEQIGSTLLFVGAANDEELEKIENCVIG